MLLLVVFILAAEAGQHDHRDFQFDNVADGGGADEDFQVSL